MITIHYPDGSEGHRYENGDLVRLKKDRPRALFGNKAGEWGAVRLTDREDRKRGSTGPISFVSVETAGVSTPEESFQQRIPSVPVWELEPYEEVTND